MRIPIRFTVIASAAKQSSVPGTDPGLLRRPVGAPRNDENGAVARAVGNLLFCGPQRLAATHQPRLISGAGIITGIGSGVSIQRRPMRKSCDVMSLSVKVLGTQLDVF